jgi:hypothetical protein
MIVGSGDIVRNARTAGSGHSSAVTEVSSPADRGGGRPATPPGRADRSITVQRSYDSDTTKGGRADVIPIAEPLVPYLEAAIATSPSNYVFPAADGSIRSDETDLQQICDARLGVPG